MSWRGSRKLRRLSPTTDSVLDAARMRGRLVKSANDMSESEVAGRRPDVLGAPHSDTTTRIGCSRITRQRCHADAQSARCTRCLSAARPPRHHTRATSVHYLVARPHASALHTQFTHCTAAGCAANSASDSRPALSRQQARIQSQTPCCTSPARAARTASAAHAALATNNPLAANVARC